MAGDRRGDPSPPDDEGVRILPPGEALERARAGDVGSRRFAPRSGDVPEAPDVPDGALTFGGGASPPAPRLRAVPAEPAESSPWAPDGADRGGRPATARPWAGGDVDPDLDEVLELSDDGPIDVGPATGPVRLPDWTDPPTGQVPKVVLGDDDDWATRTGSQPHWRGERDDWESADFDDGLLDDAEGEVRLGALDSNRAAESDLFSFEEELPSQPVAAVGGPADPDGLGAVAVGGGGERPADRMADRSADRDVISFDDLPQAAAAEQAVTPIRTRAPRDDEGGGGGTPPGGFGGRDMPMALAVGGGFAVVAGALFLVFEPVGPFLVVLTVVVLCAAEVFGAFTRAGTKPATPLGLVAAAGCVVAVYAKGAQALPAVLAISVIATFLWFLSKAGGGRPVLGMGTTLLGILWVGGLGSFAAAMLTRHIGRSGTMILFGAVLCTVASDVGGLVAGSMFGRAPLAPDVSPNKTVEGTLGGLALAVVVGAGLGLVSDTWDGAVHGMLLGLTAGVLAPIGDLCQSMVKRDLGLKDMGTALPGHGGFLDRFDSLLFVLPGVFYLASALDLFTYR